jgi:hypothetical protein
VTPVGGTGPARKAPGVAARVRIERPRRRLGLGGNRQAIEQESTVTDA